MREKTQAGYLLGKTATAQDCWVPFWIALLPISTMVTMMMAIIMIIMMVIMGKPNKYCR